MDMYILLVVRIACPITSEDDLALPTIKAFTLASGITRHHYSTAVYLIAKALVCITVAVFRCVAVLLLSVMSRVGEGVTFGHLLPVGAGYPVPAGSRVL